MEKVDKGCLMNRMDVSECFFWYRHSGPRAVKRLHVCVYYCLCSIRCALLLQCSMVCLSVSWMHWWALKKWLSWSRCCLESAYGAQGTIITWVPRSSQGKGHLWGDILGQLCSIYSMLFATGQRMWYSLSLPVSPAVICHDLSLEQLVGTWKQCIRQHLCRRSESRWRQNCLHVPAN